MENIHRFAGIIKILYSSYHSYRSGNSWRVTSSCHIISSVFSKKNACRSKSSQKNGGLLDDGRSQQYMLRQNRHTNKKPNDFNNNMVWKIT